MLLVDKANPRITTTMLGFDYARCDTTVSLLQSSFPYQPLHAVWCNVVSNVMLDHDPHVREACLTVQYELLACDKLEIRRCSRLTCQS